MKKKVLMIAGETSGEQLGIPLIEACKDSGLDLEIEGLVGLDLQKNGVKSIHDCRPLEIIGFIDPILSFYKIWRCFQAATNYMKREKPDLVILIDHASFNLCVAAHAKKLNIPVLFYVSPQVWAWRERRVSKIVKLVDHMMVLFPFEVPIYKNAGLPVTNISHPLLKSTVAAERADEARKKFSINEDMKVVTLMPGSRNGEILRHTPELAKTAKRLALIHPDIVFIAPLAREEHKVLFEKLWLNAEPELPLPLICNRMVHTAVRAANAVIVASGTASLEVALLERPAVVIYKTNAISYFIIKWLIKIPYISLPNILLNKEVYPEFIQDNLDSDKVAKYVSSILVGDGSLQVGNLKALRELLKGSESSQGASVVHDLLDRKLRLNNT